MSKILALLLHFFSGAGVFALGVGLVVAGLSLNVVAGGSTRSTRDTPSAIELATADPAGDVGDVTTEVPLEPEPCDDGSDSLEGDTQAFEVVGLLVVSDDDQITIDTPAGLIVTVPVTNLEIRSQVNEGDEVFVSGERQGGVLIATTIGQSEDRCVTPTPTPSPRPTRRPTPSPSPNRGTATPAPTEVPTRRPTASPTLNSPPPSDSSTPAGVVDDSPEASPQALIPRLVDCFVDLLTGSSDSDCW